MESMQSISDENSSAGQIIKLGTEDGGSSFGDMASVGDMAMDMASLDDDQSGSYHIKKGGTTVNAMRPDIDDDEQEAGQSFD